MGNVIVMRNDQYLLTMTTDDLYPITSGDITTSTVISGSSLTTSINIITTSIVTSGRIITQESETSAESSKENKSLGIIIGATVVAVIVVIVLAAVILVKLYSIHKETEVVSHSRKINKHPGTRRRLQ